MSVTKFGLKPSAALSKGRILKRVTSGGEEKCALATDKTRAGGELILGVSMDTITDAGTDVAVDIIPPGEWALVETGAAITVAHHYLTFDATGRTISGPTIATDIVTALNLKGQTASGSGEFIEVFLIHNP